MYNYMGKKLIRSCARVPVHTAVFSGRSVGGAAGSYNS